MSLSRPSRPKFPLLKLPWLCIDCIIKCCDIFDIIFFASISRKTRRIVKSLKISMNRIELYLTIWNIRLGISNKTWVIHDVAWLEEHEKHLRKDPLVLQKNAIPFYTYRMNYALYSYTHQNLRNAFKMAMEFLNEVFNCSVEIVDIYGDKLPESGDIGVKSTVNLCIKQYSTQPFGYAQSQKLQVFLENLEVTGTCRFLVHNRGKDFYCDPKLFKCKKLILLSGSAAWVTREILLQFEVPQLKFDECPFSMEDILSFVTHWFHSDNKKLEFLHILIQSTRFSLEKFQTAELNPVPFSGRNRVPLTESFNMIDFSTGLEIVRHDGLQATIHIGKTTFMFYIWHN